MADIDDQNGNPGTGTVSTSWLTDTTPPTSTVNALPSRTSSTSFTVTVTSNDPAGTGGSPASGLASIAIYESVNGGAFSLWTTVTPASPSAAFTGQVGHTYGFYSVATDAAGNVQPTPTAAQATTTVAVAAASTSTTVRSSEDPARFGDAVTFTATVSSPSGTPTGTVQFQVNGTPDGSPIQLVNGSASFMPKALSPGPHTVTAAYTSADGSFATSSGTLAGGQSVIVLTTTAVSSSEDPARTGDTVTFTATVSAVPPSGGTPTGTIQFQIDGVNSGAPVGLVNGSASYSTSAYGRGHPLRHRGVLEQ